MGILAESFVRGTVLALGVAVVLRALRICSPRLAHRAWTAVVVVQLLLPITVTWGPEVAVPLLPHPPIVMSASMTGAVAAGVAEHVPKTTAPATADVRNALTWVTVATTVYLAGAMLFLLRLAIGLWRARAMSREAVLQDGRLTHAACVTPMTVGIVVPVIILPVDWASWDAAELSAVLAHEDEHVRRRDPLVAALAFLNRAIFWFSPLAWWLQREIGWLSEQACDEVVISRGHDRDIYSACLVRFARRAAHAGGRIVPTATAMPGAGLQKRLGMLGRAQAGRLSPLRRASAGLACSAIVVVCATAAPSAVPAQDVPSPRQTSWSVQTTDHFEVFHENIPATRVSEAVQEAEAAYAHLSAALKHDMPRRIPIVLVRRDRDLGPDLAPPGDATSRQRVVMSLESFDRGTGLIVHELTHQFAFEIVPATSRIDPDLIEGLAEYQRGAWSTEDLRLTRDAVAAGVIPAVTSLVNTDRHWAHAVFDFVSQQYGEEGVRRLLFALRTRETLPQAVPMAFGITIERFDQGFRDFAMVRYGRR